MCTGIHPFIPAANTARLRMVYQLYGQVCMNVLHFRFATQPDALMLGDLAETAIEAWGDNIQGISPDALALSYAEATDLTVEFGAQQTVTSSLVGSVNAVALPGGSTIALKFGTGAVGRSQRGRMYLVGLTVPQLSGDNVITAVADAILDAWEQFFTDVETGTSSDHVVVSYCTDGAWRTSGQVREVLSYQFVDTHVDSMRSRLAGRGI